MSEALERFNPCNTDACAKQCDSMGIHCTEICINEIERLRQRVKELEESEKRWIKQAADFELLASIAQKRSDREAELRKAHGEPVAVVRHNGLGFPYVDLLGKNGAQYFGLEDGTKLYTDAPSIPDCNTTQLKEKLK